ncbi:hypothetical protein [Hymenobacter siberiensis]|jgi:hypothetical protein|uniref:hypothetical protein n=1 Tax=Hymenobacter siberiensis TaxID=2848396 RepID=UPI001C1DF07D|nr:hypothetical protein [Hymenobacter siberiensis]MBU6122337.1 hypothetical protein [Hymenobacter siberiensis]
MPLLSRAQETLFFQNTAGKVFYQPSGFVRLVWAPERAVLEAIQTFYEQVMTLMLRTATRKILSEHGQRAPLSGAAQEWLTGHWIPRAINEVRAQYCAIVEGADPMHRLSTQSVVSGAPAGLIFQRFSTMGDAEKWLQEAEMSR